MKSPPGSAEDPVPWDKDDDGITDSSEMHYFANLTATDDTGDFDHDGNSDATKLRLGPNPGRVFCKVVLKP